MKLNDTAQHNNNGGYIGHKRDDGKAQPLRDHLYGVARLAEDFARPFSAGGHAALTGDLHDVGKYGSDAQARMKDPKRVKKVDHSTAGVQQAFARRDVLMAFAIAGHHGGMPDMGSRASTSGDGTLMGRVLKQIPRDYATGMKEISLPDASTPAWLDLKDRYAMSFYTRMLFSCLVDADFLDTEAFMRPDAPERGGGDGMEALFNRLMDKTAKWANPSKAINKKRCDILAQCLAAGQMPCGLYSLTVPTGGGKTVSSLAFALAHALYHGKSRIIYVIPYTSIIDQNAAIFSDILGENNVISHHSAIDMPDDPLDAQEESEKRRRLASENWDAPIVVTTAVQFFESLHASRPGKCRKLHNIANSVVIFDEAQMIPVKYLKPCVAAIAQLVRNYDVTAVLCTATQPYLKELFARFAPDMTAHEICADVEDMFEFFKRVSFQMEGEIGETELAARISAASQVLCIVNTRARARRIYDLLPPESRFHLSTLMTARHRKKILGRIRDRLNEGKTCRVVSTSLIEAGVDIDFPTVWREKAGLDSIIQAAGRCNREAENSPGESVVHVFSCPGAAPLMFRQNIDASDVAMSAGYSIDDPACVEMYFKSLYKFKGDSIDQKKILEKCENMEFRTVANEFKLIDENTMAIYIPDATDEKNVAALNALRHGEYTRETLRRLATSAVNVYESHLIALLSAGKLECTADGFYILSDMESYNYETGLSLQSDPGSGIWI
ncbi:MAG: CRISPR-associated helicase Cas3' [Clostridia bacterium]|nr:CRISPR-associated helicase Cas3' [Clostridia bacterium]